MKKNDSISNPVLRTWDGLNDHLRVSVDEQALEKLLKEELDGRRRKMFVSRIHARLNRVRCQAERDELRQVTS